MISEEFDAGGSRFSNWTCDDVCLWLDSIMLPKLAPVFQRHNIQGSQLIGLSNHKLEEMGVESGLVRKKILREAEMLKHTNRMPNINLQLMANVAGCSTQGQMLGSARGGSRTDMVDNGRQVLADQYGPLGVQNVEQLSRRYAISFDEALLLFTFDLVGFNLVPTKLLEHSISCRLADAMLQHLCRAASQSSASFGSYGYHSESPQISGELLAALMVASGKFHNLGATREEIFAHILLFSAI